jgi:hypothetical protein
MARRKARRKTKKKRQEKKRQEKWASKIAKLAGETPRGRQRRTRSFDTPEDADLRRGNHVYTGTAVTLVLSGGLFGRPELRRNDYASGTMPPSRLSSVTTRDISPKQAALAISDDQNATQSKAGMTLSSSAG